MNDCETSFRRHDAWHPHVTKEKDHRILSHLVMQNLSQTVAQLTAQYNAGPSRNVSEHTVNWTLLDTGLRSRLSTQVPLDQASLSAMSILCPGTSQMDYGSVEESCLIRWITVCLSSRRRPCENASSFAWMVAVSVYSMLMVVVLWFGRSSLGSHWDPWLR